MWVHKLDANGVPVWNEPRTGTPDTRGFDVAVDAEGQIYVAGARTVHHPDDENIEEDDAVVWEYDPDGGMQGWAFFDNNDDYDWGDDRANGVAVLTDGSVVLAGETAVAGENNDKVAQAAVFEYSQHELAMIWTGSGGGFSASSAHDIVGDASTGIVFVGWTQAAELEPRRLEVRQLDDSLETSWTYPGFPEATHVGEAYAVARDPEGRFAVGASVEVDSQRDAHVFVANEHGGPTWFPPFTYNGSDSGDDHVYGVATDRFGYVYYTGAETIDGKSRFMVGKLHP